jgi:DNA (cytosine-5)-methyltransferase 1
MIGTAFRQARSGLYVPDHVRLERPTCFSLFSGCGGFDLGFIQAGWEVVGANEYDPTASLTYMVNLASYPCQIHYIGGQADKDRLNKACERYIFGKGRKESCLRHDSGLAGSGFISHHPELAPVRHFWFGDVRQLHGKDILEVLNMEPGDLDCVCGGPPCQGFSRSGKQQIADPRNNLVYEFGRLIVELQPKTFVMENVPDIVNFFDPDGVPVLDKLSMMVSAGGYGKWEAVKKAMLMQSGAAGVIRTGKGTVKLEKRKQSKEQLPDMESRQIGIEEADHA